MDEPEDTLARNRKQVFDQLNIVGGCLLAPLFIVAMFACYVIFMVTGLVALVVRLPVGILLILNVEPITKIVNPIYNGLSWYVNPYKNLLVSWVDIDCNDRQFPDDDYC